MKQINLILATTLLTVMAGCGSGKSTDDFITVDVTKSYSEKTLILQDFMDVEYIPLETTDEFVTFGLVEAIGKENILVTNYDEEGDIFIYDRTGKGLRVINRMGRGPEEYASAHSIVLDEENNEIFVHDDAQRKIVVYDLTGKFKRNLKYNQDDEILRYDFVHNFDRNHLICYDVTGTFIESRPFCHVVISKEDGSVVRRIELPFKEKKSTMIRLQEGKQHLYLLFLLNPSCLTEINGYSHSLRPIQSINIYRITG